MSYILDALNKLERKRPHGSVPDLSTVHDPAPREPDRVVGRLWLTLAAVLLGTAGLLAWLRPWEPAAQPTVSRQADVRRETGPPLVVVSVFPAPEGKAPPMTTEKAPPAAPRQEPAPNQPPSPAPPETGPVVSPSLPVEAEVAVQALPDQAPPPESTPQEILNLRISGHIFSEEPGLRMILIDNKVLREGDLVSDGFRVEEITPGGAAIGYRGKRYEVKGRTD